MLRAAALTDGPVTINLDTSDVDVYGRKNRGVAWNHQGQRVGRPHVATWAETETVPAADLGDGTDDPRSTAPDLLRRARGAHRLRDRRQAARRSCGGCWPTSSARTARRHRDGRRPGRPGAVLPGLMACRYPAADPPGPTGPRPGIRRPRVAAPPHATPGPARPAVPLAGGPACRLRLLVHRDEPRRVQPGQGRRRALGSITAPRWRTSSVTARSAPPSCTSIRIPQVNTAWIWGALLAHRAIRGIGSDSRNKPRSRSLR